MKVEAVAGKEVDTSALVILEPQESSRIVRCSPSLAQAAGQQLILVWKASLDDSKDGSEREEGTGEKSTGREGEAELVMAMEDDSLGEGNVLVVAVGEKVSQWTEGKKTLDFVSAHLLVLSEVILVAADARSMAYASGEDEADFAFHLTRGREGRVLGDGDVLCMPGDYQYHVQHCSPFRQGFLPPLPSAGGPDTATSVIVVPPMPLGEEEMAETSLAQSSPASPPRTPPHARRPSMGMSAMHSLLFPQSPGANVTPLASTSVLISGIDKPVGSGDEDSDVTRVGEASEALMRCLCVASGSWVRLNTSQGSAAIRLFTRPDSRMPGMSVRVPPTVMFALGIPIGGRERGTAVGVPTVGVSGLSFPTASKVTIGRVSSLYSYEYISMKDVAALFSKMSLVAVGDVLLVSSKRVAFIDHRRFAAAQRSAASDGSKDDVQAMYDDLVHAEVLMGGEDAVKEHPVFYQVTGIEVGGKQHGSEAYVDREKTELVEQGDVVHTRVPGGMVEFLKGQLPGIPVGLREEYTTLETALAPMVSGNLQKSGRELRCSFLVHGSRGSGKRSLVATLASRLGVHLLSIDCFDLVDPVDARTVTNLEVTFEDAFTLRPSILLLRNVGSLERAAGQEQRESMVASAFRECINKLSEATSQSEEANDGSLPGRRQLSVTVVATESDVDRLSSNFRSCFHQELRLQSPDESQRYSMLRDLLKETEEQVSGAGSRIFARSLAVKTAGCTVGDLEALCALARGSSLAGALDRCERVAGALPPTIACGLGASLQVSDLEKATDHIQASQAEELGAPKVPNVQWDDVGGLAAAKKDIVDTIQLPLEFPHLFADGLRLRSGVLLYGPPGTGKTLLAKAVATECSLNFLSVKGPELISSYVGESEKNIRDVFQRARNARPCVIFFDELDSLAPARGHGSDGGGVMDRVVSQLLAELDGLQESSSVFVIGATNRPDLLDPALLRPGRLDKLLFLGVCNTTEAQLPVLRALTRKFDLHADLKLESVAKRCPLTFTGADFYALCTDALMAAMKERVALVDAVHASVAAGKVPREAAEEALSVLEQEKLLVEERHFLDALPGITPSVSPAELKKYEELRRKYSSAE